MQKIRHILALIVALSLAIAASAQEPPQKPLNQYIVLIKHGPKWLPGKSVAQQPLLSHGKYLHALMEKGKLQFAGAFLDDSGGLYLLNAADESEARRIAENDPGVLAQIIEAEIRPIQIAFDAATGKSPFK
jgi:uncharacterized protein YciI